MGRARIWGSHSSPGPPPHYSASITWYGGKWGSPDKGSCHGGGRVGGVCHIHSWLGAHSSLRSKTQRWGGGWEVEDRGGHSGARAALVLFGVRVRGHFSVHIRKCSLFPGG